MQVHPFKWERLRSTGITCNRAGTGEAMFPLHRQPDVRSILTACVQRALPISVRTETAETKAEQTQLET